jgi:hypothetical protein
LTVSVFVWEPGCTRPRHGFAASRGRFPLCALTSACPPGDPSAPPRRGALRRRTRRVEGALREPLRLLAGVRGQSGRRLSRLRHPGHRLRARAVWRLPGRVPRRLLLQGPRAVPVVCGQTCLSARCLVARRGPGRCRPCAVGVFHPEDAEAGFSFAGGPCDSTPTRPSQMTSRAPRARRESIPARWLYHRRLLGRLCQAAYQTARDMISAALPAEEALIPGMIAVVQTFGDELSWHPRTWGPPARVARLLLDRLPPWCQNVLTDGSASLSSGWRPGSTPSARRPAGG